MVFRMMLVIVACRAISAQPVVAQLQPNVSADTTGVLLVGRTETARAVINVVEAPFGPDGRWHGPGTPIAAGLRHSLSLWTDLPITLGGVTLEAGRHRLWPVLADGRPVLVVSRAMEDAPGRFDPSREVARVELAAEELVWSEPVLRALIHTTRLGPDTVGFVDRSTRGRKITGIVIHPASTSVLVLHAGQWRFTAPIGAR